MLNNSYEIQMNEAKYRKKKSCQNKSSNLTSSRQWKGNYDSSRLKEKLLRQKNGAEKMLYDAEDVKKTCSLIKNGGYPYEQWIKIAKGIELKFYPSGHVLGGAICVFRIAKRDGFLHLGFEGDLGRADGIILPPPVLVKEPINWWITESTYGGKKHPPRKDEIEKLLEIISEAARKKQRIIIPSFALERTQEIIYLITLHVALGNIPELPIYLDYSKDRMNCKSIRSVPRKTSCYDWSSPRLRQKN